MPLTNSTVTGCFHPSDGSTEIRRQLASGKEVKQYAARIPMPKKYEPWQFTQSANSGGNPHSQRRSREPSSNSKSSTQSREYPIMCGRMAVPILAKNQAQTPQRKDASGFAVRR